jgi:hypothetical protein
MDESFADWDSDPPAIEAEVEQIDHFDARGMRCVYGRGDDFGPHRKFHMVIWITRAGRLVMRFWSYCQDIHWRSFEIKGVDTSGIPGPDEKTRGYEESWVPDAVRKAYEEWILQEG